MSDAVKSESVNSGSVKSAWSAKSERDLFLTILEHALVAGVKWDTITADMNAKGYNFGPSACLQHYRKIRKDAASGGGKTGSAAGSAPGSAAGSATGTPTKPKTVAAVGTPPKPRNTVKPAIFTPQKRKNSATGGFSGGVSGAISGFTSPNTSPKKGSTTPSPKKRRVSKAELDAERLARENGVDVCKPVKAAARGKAEEKPSIPDGPVLTGHPVGEYKNEDEENEV